MKQFLLTLHLFAATCFTTFAQWPANKNFPIQVAASPQHENLKGSAEDGNGGVFLVWQREAPITFDRDLYIAHYNQDGVRTFADVIYMSAPDDSEQFAGVTSDGAGGAIVVWGDQRGYSCYGGCDRKFYGQHFSDDGSKMWEESGRLLYDGIVDFAHTGMGIKKLLKGSQNDFYLLWEEIPVCAENCPNTTARILAQRYDQDGSAQWPNPEEVFSSVDLIQDFNFDAKYDPSVDRIFIAWQDGRANTCPNAGFGQGEWHCVVNYDIYAQSINGTTGAKVWDASGVPVNTIQDFGTLSIDYEPNPEITLDGSNGFLVTWIDYRVDGEGWIYGSRRDKINGTKTGSWPVDGKKLSGSEINSIMPLEGHARPFPYAVQLGADNTYMIAYTAEDNNLYTRQFSTSGVLSNATLVSNDNSLYNIFPKIIRSGNESIVLWTKTSGTLSAYTGSFQAQKIDQTGNQIWNEPVQLTSVMTTMMEFQVQPDLDGGVIVMWTNSMNGFLNPNVKMTSIISAGKFKAGLTLIAGAAEGSKGQTIQLPVSVRDFEDILTLQSSITWDPAVLSFVGVEDFALPNLTENSFGVTNTESGSLSFSWDDEDLDGITLPQNATIFTISFQLIGNPEQYSDIIISNSPVPIEAYYETEYAEASVNTEDGFIYITGYALSISSYYLNGNISGEPGGPIANTNFFLDNDLIATSGENGMAFLENLIPLEGQTQALSARKIDNDKTGVDVADLIRLRDHVVGTEPFTSAFQIFAGDADANGKLSTIDIARIRGYILGKQDDFNGKTWIFVNDYQFFTNEQKFNIGISPFSYESVMQLAYDDLSIEELLSPGALRFVGVKLGDIDASWAVQEEIENGRVKQQNTVTVLAEISSMKINEPFTANFKMENGENIAGIQFTLSWNPNDTKFVDVIPSALPIVFNLDQVESGFITLLWNGEANETLSATANVNLFGLGFLSTGGSPAFEINSTRTRAIAYDNKFERFAVSLTTNDQEGLSISKIYPVPFNDKLNIEFNAPTQSRVSMVIVNSLGTVVFEDNNMVESGRYHRVVDTSKFANGLYICKLKIGHETRTVTAAKVN
jgi:hypothetical protein